MIKRYNISKPEKYISGEQEKTAWKNVGILTIFEKDNGTQSMIVEIPAIGLKANAFPIEPKENRRTKVDEPISRETADVPTVEIEPENLPF